MPTYTFRCPYGHEFDARVSMDTQVYPSDRFCGCEATAARVPVYRINFGGFARTPASERDWSGDFKNYQEANGEIDYRKGRLEDAMQKQLPDPPLYRAAKQRANALIKAGAKDANDLP